jgi:hypothetical protein
MATRTAILNVRIALNQCLEEIAKKEAPISTRVMKGFASHNRNQAIISRREGD